MKHTLGPWELEDTTLAICRLIVTVEDVNAIEVHPASNANRVIAYLPSDTREHEQRANARLIASAPELLAALDELVKAVERDDNPIDEGLGSTADEMTRARAALQSASGSPEDAT